MGCSALAIASTYVGTLPVMTERAALYAESLATAAACAAKESVIEANLLYLTEETVTQPDWYLLAAEAVMPS